jgi:hypothetical protein
MFRLHSRWYTFHSSAANRKGVPWEKLGKTKSTRGRIQRAHTTFTMSTVCEKKRPSLARRVKRLVHSEPTLFQMLRSWFTPSFYLPNKTENTYLPTKTENTYPPTYQNWKYLPTYLPTKTENIYLPTKTENTYIPTHGAVEVYNYVFLTSTLLGGEWSASRPYCFNPDTHGIECWVAHRRGLQNIKL